MQLSLTEKQRNNNGFTQYGCNYTIIQSVITAVLHEPHDKGNLSLTI